MTDIFHKKTKKQQHHYKLINSQSINYPKEFELICYKNTSVEKSSEFFKEKIQKELNMYRCFISTNQGYSMASLNTATLHP